MSYEIGTKIYHGSPFLFDKPKEGSFFTPVPILSLGILTEKTPSNHDKGYIYEFDVIDTIDIPDDVRLIPSMFFSQPTLVLHENINLNNNSNDPITINIIKNLLAEGESFIEERVLSYNELTRIKLNKIYVININELKNLIITYREMCDTHYTLSPESEEAIEKHFGFPKIE